MERIAVRRRALDELRRHRLRRGWSLEDVAWQLIELGRQIGEPNLGVNANMVGRWERGERFPRPPYPKLLALLYGCSAEELELSRRGLPSLGDIEDDMERRDLLRVLGAAALGPVLRVGASDPEELGRAVRRPSRVEPDTLEVIEGSIENYRRMDDLLGSRAAVPPALALRDLVARLLGVSQSDHVRQRLCAAASQISQFLGWLAFDMGDHRIARMHFKEGLQAAHEAGDHALSAYILAYLSILATYSGEPQEGLAFSEAARSRAKQKVTSATYSWLATVEAEAWAALQARGPAQQALERAERTLSNAQREDDPRWIYHYDQAGLTSAAGTCYLVLGIPELARRAMNETISLSGFKEVREQAVYSVRLAATYVAEGEIEEACRLGVKAITIAEETSSERAVQRVREFRGQLDPWSDSEPVRELDEQLHVIRR